MRRAFAFSFLAYAAIFAAAIYGPRIVGQMGEARSPASAA